MPGPTGTAGSVARTSGVSGDQDYNEILLFGNPGSIRTFDAMRAGSYLLVASTRVENKSRDNDKQLVYCTLGIHNGQSIMETKTLAYLAPAGTTGSAQTLALTITGRIDAPGGDYLHDVARLSCWAPDPSGTYSWVVAKSAVMNAIHIND